MTDGGLTVRAYLGLGGNIGEPERAMAAGLRALDAASHVRLSVVSSLYRTPPWGLSEQPDFLNAVAAVDAQLSARDLLDLCLETERSLKRVRTERWGPRVIDMDILLFGDETIDEEGLQVPHSRMSERAFVLAPLAEIAPGLDVQGLPVETRLAKADSAGIVRLPGGGDWWRAGERT